MADPVTTSSHRIAGVTGAHEAPAKRGMRESTGRIGSAYRTGTHIAPKASSTSRTGAFSATRISTGITAALGISNSGLHEAVKPPKPAKPKMSAAKKRKIYFITVVLAVVMIIAAAFTLNSTTSASKYNNYIETAYTLCDNGDYEAALTNLRKAAAIKESDEIYVLMAKCYVQLNNYDRALEILRGLGSGDESVQYLIGEIQSRRDHSLTAGMVRINNGNYAPETSELTIAGMQAGNGLVFELTQLYGLTNLSIPGNNITDISGLNVLGGLISLNLSENRISDISALSELVSLRSLNLDYNPVRDFSPLYGLSELTMLSIKGVEISDEQLAELSAALPQCAIYTEAESYDNDDITIGGITFSPDVTKIDLSGLGITDISALSACKNLTEIILDDNRIYDISPLMDIPGLEKLSISGNAVSDLRPLISLSNLSYLNAADNEISSTVALGSIASLRTVILDGNPLTDFSGISKLTELESLSMKGTGLTDEILPEFYGLAKLKSMNIDENDEISGEAFDELKRTLRGCQISHAKLVYSVEIGGESIRLDSTELILTGKGITDISMLNQFNQLETINLSGNNLSNIYILEYTKSPISWLDLSSNNIQDATALSVLFKLTYLDVSYNSISSINPFITLTKLEYLNLTGNNFTEEQIQTLQHALPDCEIVY